MRILEHLLGRSGYNKKGEELPDSTPKELKIDLEAEMPLELKVMRALQSDDWKRRMEQQGRETWEEANDFYIDEEEPEFKSFHEDEDGDVMAFEEGKKRGFIEEIPDELKERVYETSKKVEAFARAARAPRYRKDDDNGLRTAKTSDGGRSEEEVDGGKK